ncbi:MAG: AbrB/MazE/SpoVT family DNA-binding domain-containing protein [Candidatus Thermoplasmatota archaeon]
MRPIKRRIIQQGNSYAILIPREIMELMGWEKGDEVLVPFHKIGKILKQEVILLPEKEIKIDEKKVEVGGILPKTNLPIDALVCDEKLVKFRCRVDKIEKIEKKSVLHISNFEMLRSPMNLDEIYKGGIVSPTLIKIGGMRDRDGYKRV